jgi:ABC-2 type transport system ATP-binding protein
VAGHEVVKERDKVRQNIGLVLQDATLDGYLTGEQNLRFHADLYGVPRQQVAPCLRQPVTSPGSSGSACGSAAWAGTCGR